MSPGFILNRDCQLNNLAAPVLFYRLYSGFNGFVSIDLCAIEIYFPCYR